MRGGGKARARNAAPARCARCAGSATRSALAPPRPARHLLPKPHAHAPCVWEAWCLCWKGRWTERAAVCVKSKSESEAKKKKHSLFSRRKTLSLRHDHPLPLPRRAAPQAGLLPGRRLCHRDGDAGERCVGLAVFFCGQAENPRCVCSTTPSPFSYQPDTLIVDRGDGAVVNQVRFGVGRGTGSKALDARPALLANRPLFPPPPPLSQFTFDAVLDGDAIQDDVYEVRQGDKGRERMLPRATPSRQPACPPTPHTHPPKKHRPACATSSPARWPATTAPCWPTARRGRARRTRCRVGGGDCLGVKKIIKNNQAHTDAHKKLLPTHSFSIHTQGPTARAWPPTPTGASFRA